MPATQPRWSQHCSRRFHRFFASSKLLLASCPSSLRWVAMGGAWPPAPAPWTSDIGSSRHWELEPQALAQSKALPRLPTHSFMVAGTVSIDLCIQAARAPAWLWPGSTGGQETLSKPALVPSRRDLSRRSAETNASKSSACARAAFSVSVMYRSIGNCTTRHAECHAHAVWPWCMLHAACTCSAAVWQCSISAIPINKRA